ncbi:MAG TPA: type II toxin-antitoxin system VapC family toxin [Xanthobacteraceae bacterium]
MIFVDSSAIVALLASEQDAPMLAKKIEINRERISAGHVILESSMRLATLLGVLPTAADELVTRLLHEAEIAIVPITEEIAHHAVAAFERYGKGRRNRAGLNFGDCLSYACAKAHHARILFKGGDFTHTDIARA